MTNNIKTGIYARQGIANGINQIADAVKLTLGAKGRNAIIQSDFSPGHLITNDGISIAKEAYFEDPLEQIGANIIKEVADRTNKESGDGTTTSIVLLQAILNEGMKENLSGMEVKNSLDELLPMIEESIDKQKKEITEADVHSVATISAESEELGNLIGKIYQEITKEGIIELDNSKTFETTYEIKEGVRLKNAGFISPYMANSGKKAIYKKPLILITKQKISVISDIEPLIEKLMDKGIGELVIFTDDMDSGVAGRLIATHLQGNFKVLIIKAPIIWKDYIFEDFAKITGATVIGDASGTTLKSLTLAQLGTCDKIITDREETTVLGIKDISEHIKDLQEKGDDDSRLRLSWLTTKAAILKIGANSESELSYKRLKAEDAINAARLALQDGVVPGGGLTLFRTALKMPDTIGGNILREALKMPMKQIIENAGDSLEDLKVKHGEMVACSPSRIYDAKQRKIVDEPSSGIEDPAKVVKNAIKNAISIAGTVLTSEIVMIKPKKSIEEMQLEVMSKAGRPF